MGAAPHTLRCHKCSRRENFKDMNRRSGRDIVRTGKVRENQNAKTKRGYTHGRTRIQVKHLLCGHVWWTLHRGAAHQMLESTAEHLNALAKEVNRTGRIATIGGKAVD